MKLSAYAWYAKLLDLPYRTASGMEAESSEAFN